MSPFAPRKLRGDRYFCGAKGDTWTFIDRTILNGEFDETVCSFYIAKPSNWVVDGLFFIPFLPTGLESIANWL